MVRRYVVFAILILSVAMLLPAGVGAQDASPPAGPPARDLSLLRALGLPEIDLVATESGVTGVTPEVAAGRYLVTLENRTADQVIETDFVDPPQEIGQDETLRDLGGNGETGETPAWFYDAAWAGGPTADPGATDGVVVDLGPGDWWLSAQRTVDADVQPAGTNVAVRVTGDPPSAGEIVGAVSIALTEYSFAFPATIPSGPQIWQVTNTGQQPHLLDLVGVPDGTTFDQVMDLLGFAFTGTPAASALGFEDIREVYSIPNLSPGQHLGIEVDLAPGTYVAVCFISDRENGAPHALMGMVQVFTVG